MYHAVCSDLRRECDYAHDLDSEETFRGEICVHPRALSDAVTRGWRPWRHLLESIVVIVGSEPTVEGNNPRIVWGFAPLSVASVLRSILACDDQRNICRKPERPDGHAHYAAAYAATLGVLYDRW